MLMTDLLATDDGYHVTCREHDVVAGPLSLEDARAVRRRHLEEHIHELQSEIQEEC